MGKKTWVKNIRSLTDVDYLGRLRKLVGHLNVLSFDQTTEISDELRCTSHFLYRYQVIRH